MANLSLTTSVQLCEDISESYSLIDLFAQAGYSVTSATALQFFVEQSDGSYVTAPADSFIKADGSGGVLIDLSVLPDFNGLLGGRVVALDSNGNIVTLSINIDVGPVNDAPEGSDGGATIDEGGAYVFAASDFGFADPVEGDNFVGLIIDSLPAGGQLLLNGVAVAAGDEVPVSVIDTGALVFQADPGFSGDAAFDFRVRDDGGIDPDCGGVDTDLVANTFTVTVLNVNDVPVAVDDAYSTNQDTPVSASLAGNDTPSSDGGNVWMKLTDPANGTVVVNPDGTFTYTPNPGYAGPDSFTYKITDIDGDVSEATATIIIEAVNDVPVAVDDSYTTAEDTPVSASLAGNDTPSSDGGNVWMKLTDPANGTVVVNPDGTFTYTPDANFSGTDSFTYKITDIDGDVSEATATITIEPGNDVPVAVDDSYTTAEDTPVNGDLSGNDTPSPDGGNVWMKLTDPANGTVVVNPDGTFTYTPDANFSGTDSFTYKITDIDGDVSEATATITIEPGNDVPVAVDDSYTTAEDTPVNGDLSGNDTPSPDGGNVWMKLTDPANGTVVVNPDGTFTYTPDANFSGTDSFTYKITDIDGDVSEATATITIEPGNDVPVAVDDSYTTAEDTPVNGDLSGNDTPSPDGGNVWMKLTDPANGTVVVNPDGTFTYTPDANFSGTDSFTYKITDIDGDVSEATATITIEPGNDVPVAVDDSYTTAEDTPVNGDLSGNDTPSPDGGNVWMKLTDPANGTVVVNPDGTFTYTPDANFSGTDSFTYKITDIDGDVSEATATITIEPGNDVPVAVDDSYTTAEDTPVNGDLSGNDTPSPDGGNVWMKLTDPANGTVVVNPDGTFTYTPDANFSGTDSFTYKITDIDGDVSEATATITIEPGNDVPVAVDDDYDTGFGEPVAGDLSGNDTPSPDGGNVWMKLTDPANGTVVVNADGTFTYTPDANFSGTDSFTYKITDIDGDVSEATATITVAPPPQNASLGDTVWYDDGDGVLEAGEEGVQGVTVTLIGGGSDGVIGTADDTTDQTSTDASGNYRFDGLTVGTEYQVMFSDLPQGYEFTGQDQGGDDSLDSDADPATGKSQIVTLADGEYNDTLDAGIVAQPAHIGDRVWEDSNANGVQDAGESGIAGVTVLLKDEFGNVLDTTTTDGDGLYGFDVAPGTYSVAVEAPSGYVLTAKDAGGDDAADSDVDPANGMTDNVTVGAGERIDSVDAGLYRKAAIGDKVWLDKDGDGTQDADEAGVAGVTVNLLDEGGNVVASQSTNADGNYLFDGLMPGRYSVAFEAPAGYAFTLQDQGDDATDSDVDANGFAVATDLESGETDLTWDAGIVAQPAHIGDRVWEDSNANGVQDAGESGIAGFTVLLKDEFGNVLDTTTTDGDGLYGFDVAPGTYSVAVEAPSGYVLTAKDAGGDDAADSDVDPANGMTDNVTVGAGERIDSVDAGLYRKAAIGDKVWLDKDGDGTQDADEAGVAGVTVNLLDEGGNVVASQSTNADGNYLFDGLMPGRYSVAFEAPAGYAFTLQDQGDDATDSDVDANGFAVATDLESGETDLTWDAGIVAQPAHIGDRVWEDSNANGVQDAGESGIAGVTVLLKDEFGNVLATTTTDGDGLYGFDVAPGTYSVAVEAPSGYVLTVKDAGGDDAADSDVDPVNGMTDNVTVGAGEGIDSVDAGLYRKAAIGDKVWLDKDGDGTQDADEAGVAGVTVNLLDESGNVVASQSTNADGNYLFDGLTPGRYSVAFEAPAGYAFTTQDQGDDATDSDADANGFAVATDLESGETDLSWDAGIVELPKEEVCIQYDFNGSSRTDGYDGNIRSYEVDGVKVNVSAFYSTKDFSKFGTAYLGAYAGGLGVTDVSEGSGSGSLHAIDNVGYNNFVLFEFDRAVTVDRAFLGYVVDDSDLQVWIGNFNDPLNNHLSLNSSVLASMDFTELNGTTSTTTRWADFNAGAVSGNVLVIAADTTDTTPEDRFKIEHLEVCHEGDVVPQLAHIGDTVWLDVNGNGVQDAGEAGVAGVTVTLKDGQGNVVATTQTDANGNYGFDVAAGTYSIKVAAPDGFTFTSKDAGFDDGRDSDVDPATGRSASITVAAGETNDTLDAGLLKIAKNTGAIGDRVWEDKNVDGIQDAGEAGIAGVTVKLLDGNGNVLATTTTDTNGGYLFENLAAGSYKVQVVKPNGYYATVADKGTNDAIDSDIDSSGRTGLISLAEGETDRSVDAGLYRKASIGDKVWEDMNHNGVQDSGEPGIGGIRVTLYGWTGASQYKVGSTTTDSQGEYSFHGLDAGWYKIAFDKANVYHHSGWGGTYNMSDWYWALKDAGSDDARDSDVFSKSGDTTNTDWTWLDAGEYDMSWDAGITPIVIDLDGDGVETVSRKDAGGSFDLFGNGREIESGWVAADDALLAVDVNGNGTIDDISELFGGRSIGDGFARLASYDSNGDGRVDAADSNFGDLLVWQDADGDHQTDAGELRTLEEAGIASLSTGHVDHPFVDDQGNLHLESGLATLDDGTAVDMTDVYFNVSQGDAARAGVELPSIADLMANGGSLLSDDGSLDALLGTPAETVADPVVGSRAGEVPNHHDGLPLHQLADLLDASAYA